MKKSVVALAFMIAGLAYETSARAAFHDGPCYHVCTSPSCIVANIETWEGQNSAGCANVDMNDPTAALTYVTECARIDQLGAKKQARSALTCSAGNCTISGTFKCPSATGFKITASFQITCPPRAGGYPDAHITDHQYGWRVRADTQCEWPDGHILQIQCNEQAGSGSVFVTEF